MIQVKQNITIKKLRQVINQSIDKGLNTRMRFSATPLQFYDTICYQTTRNNEGAMNWGVVVVYREAGKEAEIEGQVPERQWRRTRGRWREWRWNRGFVAPAAAATEEKPLFVAANPWRWRIFFSLFINFL